MDSRKIRISIRSFLILFLIITTSITAQRFQYGRLKGTVKCNESNSPLEDVNVYLENGYDEHTIGCATNEEGVYFINNIPPGKYTFIAECLGYERIEIEDFEIKGNEYKYYDFDMSISVMELEGIEIVAEADKTTKEVQLISRKEEVKIMDAISSEEISSYGSSDAASAMEHVTGASVEGGKYVYVRGLGNRYSTVHLNGVELPSADPDENSFQLDLVSSSVMDNITTSKSFTPDKPGNFVGGLIDINTKSLQEDKQLDVSVSNGYNTNTTFNDYLTYQGGDTDWLGYDDGTRDIPDELQNVDLKELIAIPIVGTSNDSIHDAQTAKVLDLHHYSKAFNNIMTPIMESAPVNQSYNLNYGKKFRFSSSSFFDLISTIKYSRKFSSYDDRIINNYILTGTGADELSNELEFIEVKGEDNVNINGLLNLQYNLTRDHSYYFNTVFTQSATDIARYISGHYYDGNMDPEATYETRVLKWIERQLITNQLRGNHRFTKFFDTSFDWNMAYSLTSQDEPDTRFFSDHYMLEYDVDVYEDPVTGDLVVDTLGTYNNYFITPSLYKQPSRYFREMDEDSYNIDLKFTLPFTIYKNADSKFKTGFYFSAKDRTFRERVFQITNQEQLAYNDYDADPFSYFSDGMGIIDVTPVGPTNVRYTWGNYLVDASEDRSNYDGHQYVTAFYGMTEVPVIDRIDLTIGARYEITDMEAATQDSTYEQGKIKETDILPAGILNYRILDNLIAKLSYGKTLARPSIRELAPFPSLDFAGGFFFTGNNELERTLIDNYDVRFDFYERPGELYSLSFYYKYFKNPIEKAFLNDNKETQYQNVPRAEVKGIEIEVRKDLDQIHPFLKYFFVSSNFSYIISEVKIPESEMTAILIADPDADDTRPLQGQPEYIFNFYVQYQNRDTETHASINYNLTGEKLSENSKGGTPDIYELPKHNLNFSLSQKFWDNYSVKFGISNILNSATEKVYHYKGEDYIFTKYKTGSEYSLSLSYSL
ncbi:MAG: TonB-dependent receptor [Candidatus Delongbacteria bacterium]|nr:TonB-dependent receptor [Candidatus Delongbacteria bacterium]